MARKEFDDYIVTNDDLFSDYDYDSVMFSDDEYEWWNRNNWSNSLWMWGM